MAIRIVQLGTPRGPGEGLRIGAVRYPPRGVPSGQYSKLNYYDAWLPELSPSRSLLNRFRQKGDTPGSWKAFTKSFERELAGPQPRRLLKLLAGLSHGSDFSIGCYCQAERRCHRAVIRKVLRGHGAELDEG